MPARKPTALKLLTGSFRPDRERLGPNYSTDVPKPPAYLGKAARKYWHDLVAQLDKAGTLTQADRHMLALTSSALAEYEAARRVLDELGSTYPCKTASGAEMQRQRPENALAADAWRRAYRGLDALGLSPTARGRVTVPVGPPL